MPFSIVGADKEIDVGGRKVRGRKYPWGVIEVDNEAHCDFVKLRRMLIQSHMEELKEYTNEVLYESFRKNKLAMGGSTVASSK
jgi:septin 7